MTEPQKTIPMLQGKAITYDNIANFLNEYDVNYMGHSLRQQHVTIEIDGEYYQATLAMTIENDILDSGHLVIKPILEITNGKA